VDVNRLHSRFVVELIDADLPCPVQFCRAYTAGHCAPVIWGNRLPLHRTMPLRHLNHRRDLRRTKIFGTKTLRVYKAEAEIVAVDA
jgi:hypothetical protein